MGPPVLAIAPRNTDLEPFMAGQGLSVATSTRRGVSVRWMSLNLTFQECTRCL
jgi:hypothetical protein